MKANELMIGDWVYQALYKDAEIPNKGHVWKAVMVTYLPFDEDWAIEPIPLTEEILKKNGRLYNGGWRRYLLHDNMNVSYDLDRHQFEYKYSRIENIRYVHQLQHILRLCGLNEIADNFKVEL